MTSRRSHALLPPQVTPGQVDEVVLVGGSTRIPKVRALLRDMFGGKELSQCTHPDEAVAYGAAVHAAELSGDEFYDKMVLPNMSLGLEVTGRRFRCVIEKNTPIPCRNTKESRTVVKNQPHAGLKVRRSKNCRTLDFNL